MGKSQVIVTYALLMTNFARTDVVCPKCDLGYYKTQNCSGDHERGYGFKCGQCTDCSAIFLETLVPCSEYSNSVCGIKTTPMPTETEPDSTVFSPIIWILTGVFAFMVLVALMALFFKQMFFREMVDFRVLPSAETSSSEMKDSGLEDSKLRACPA